MKSQPMLWSVRRELWENRSIYLAPLVVSAVALFAFLMSALTGAHWPDPARPDKLTQPFDFAALLIMVTTFVVAVFYCLDALHGERRDRSILFWKSLPVSDLATVLSKAAIPLVVLPLLTFVVTVATQVMMLLVGSATLLARGHSPAVLWSGMPVFGTWPMLLYHLVTVHALYYAPIFGWLLFVSARSRRLPFVWAFLPLAAIAIVERLAFNTSHFAQMLGARISGGMGAEAGREGASMLGYFHPIQFLSSPGLWVGLILAALFLAGAARVRRGHGPI